MLETRRVAARMPVQGPESPAARSDVILLENFADELQRRVPGETGVEGRGRQNSFRAAGPFMSCPVPFAQDYHAICSPPSSVRFRIRTERRARAFDDSVPRPTVCAITCPSDICFETINCNPYTRVHFDFLCNCHQLRHKQFCWPNPSKTAESFLKFASGFRDPRSRSGQHEL